MRKESILEMDKCEDDVDLEHLKNTFTNKNLFPELETIFLMSSEKYSFISSKLVKEVHKLGGNVDKFVSKDIVKKLNKKI